MKAAAVRVGHRVVTGRTLNDGTSAGSADRRRTCDPDGAALAAHTDGSACGFAATSADSPAYRLATAASGSASTRPTAFGRDAAVAARAAAASGVRAACAACAACTTRSCCSCCSCCSTGARAGGIDLLAKGVDTGACVAKAAGELLILASEPGILSVTHAARAACWATWINRGDITATAANAATAGIAGRAGAAGVARSALRRTAPRPIARAGGSTARDPQEHEPEGAEVLGHAKLSQQEAGHSG